MSTTPVITSTIIYLSAKTKKNRLMKPVKDNSEPIDTIADDGNADNNTQARLTFRFDERKS